MMPKFIAYQRLKNKDRWVPLGLLEAETQAKAQGMAAQKWRVSIGRLKVVQIPDSEFRVAPFEVTI